MLLGFIACGASKASAGEGLDGSYRAAIGYHYSSGDYGSSSTTDILYIPLVMRAEVGRWSLQGTVPYLRISGPGGIVEGPDGPIQTAAGTSDGIGDILARGSYFRPSTSEWIPFCELVGLVKFPTASRSRGLGTGEFDFGIESELTWAVRGVTPFAMIGYRFLGSSPQTPLHDVVAAAVGGQYRVTEGINLGLLFDYRQAASATSGERMELVPFASFRVRGRWAVDLYASAGLADGSPDAGFGLQIGYILPLGPW